MKRTKRTVLQSLVLAAAATFAVAPIASAVEFRVTTVQERADELVEIESDVVENFRVLQRSQLDVFDTDSIAI
ncbi:MAG: hypothetical protein AAFY72_03010 [Cyanobacteria bacterium J06649_4]